MAALVLGIIALIGAFIPVINFVSGIVALVGLVLGIVGLVLKGRPRGMAIAGTILSGIALVTSVVLAIVYTIGFASAVSYSIRQSTQEPGQNVTVVYEVTGSGSSATVTYATVSGGRSGSEQSTGQKLPFRKELTVTTGGSFNLTSFTLTGTNGVGDSGPITCTITIDGQVVSTHTSTGQFASAVCNSSSFGSRK